MCAIVNTVLYFIHRVECDWVQLKEKHMQPDSTAKAFKHSAYSTELIVALLSHYTRISYSTITPIRSCCQGYYEVCVCVLCRVDVFWLRSIFHCELVRMPHIKTQTLAVGETGAVWHSFYSSEYFSGKFICLKSVSAQAHTLATNIHSNTNLHCYCHGQKQFI